MRILEPGHVVRFRRHDAVCVGSMCGVPYLCRVIAATGATWHRADVPLSLAECADAGTRPDVRVRCWPKAGAAGVIVGKLSTVSMTRINATVRREAALRAFEEGWRLPPS